MKKNIPSIYNYCDRWCEKCPFTSRCAVYEAENSRNAESKDISSQAYWDHISLNLKKSLDLLHKKAQKFGVDLNNIPREEVEEIARHEEKKRRRITEHKLVRLSSQYGLRVKTFLEEEEFWQQAAGEIIAHLTAGADAEKKRRSEYGQIAEYREVIGWYSLFISVKFRRALDNKMDLSEEGDTDEPDDTEVPKLDGNGSAKIALIAIERSMKAWSGVLELIPDEDRILPILAMLEKIRKLGKAEFPSAERFLRPGFDTL
jgi:hypothetical protein